ncbi:MAG: hypothetical protein K1X75_03425 [Leptospirales bacterium]|nr:hypothetical protein [Leptospirales bacterium]
MIQRAPARTQIRHRPGLLLAALCLAPLLSLPGCKRADSGDRQRGPVLDLRQALHGVWIGKAQLFDRSGDLREVILRTRRCGSGPAALSGVCQEERSYLYADRKESGALQWSARYQADFLAQIQWTQDGMNQAGDLIGSTLLVSGDTRTPLMADRIVHSQRRLIQLPDGSLLEIEDFSSFGIARGRMVTQWQQPAP